MTSKTMMKKLETLILNDMGGEVMSVTADVTSTLRAQMKHHEPIVCFEPGIARREGSESRFNMDISSTLRAVMGDNQPAVCYAIEGNVVDRVSAKNGKGWCEDVSPTLNTQDRHAVCFQFCGDRDDPSVSVSDVAYCIPANPMSDRWQAVCYEK